jgi:hypothetical protein
MTPGGPVDGGEDLRRRALAFIRTSAPFAYCDACLALRLGCSLADMALVLTTLLGETDAALTRRRRACYGCGRTLELGALSDGPPR